MTCARLYRYVELNPMRAYGPGPGYPRSSHGHKKQGLKYSFRKVYSAYAFWVAHLRSPTKVRS